MRQCVSVDLRRQWGSFILRGEAAQVTRLTLGGRHAPAAPGRLLGMALERRDQWALPPLRPRLTADRELRVERNQPVSFPPTVAAWDIPSFFTLHCAVFMTRLQKAITLSWAYTGKCSAATVKKTIRYQCQNTRSRHFISSFNRSICTQWGRINSWFDET